MRQWMARYAWDPVAFVREVLGAVPDPWQEEVLRAYGGTGTRLISIRSAKGVGKSTVLAWISVHQLLFRYPQKFMATSPSKPQLQAVLIPEVRAWIGKLPGPVQVLLEVKAETIELAADPPNSFLTFRTARDDSPESLQGLHSPWVTVVVDEASDATVPTMESIMGVLADPNPCIILAGNPLRTAGYFYDTQTSFPHWTTFHVSAFDCPRYNQTFIEQVRAEYGEDSNAYRVQILGEFPTADDDTVIPWELVEAAKTRDVVWSKTAPWIWGLDVARFGDDASALCKRRGNVVPDPIERRYKLDLMQVAGWVKNEYDMTPVSDRPALICVDVIGLGVGVVDRLREYGLPVRGVNVSESPPLTNGYRNLRAELWFKARQWLMARECRLPGNDDVFCKQLVWPRYNYAPGTGAKTIESKPEIKKRLRKSPDAADAFILTFAADAAIATHGGFGIGASAQPIRRGLAGIV